MLIVLNVIMSVVVLCCGIDVGGGGGVDGTAGCGDGVGDIDCVDLVYSVGGGVWPCCVRLY